MCLPVPVKEARLLCLKSTSEGGVAYMLTIISEGGAAYVFTSISKGGVAFVLMINREEGVPLFLGVAYVLTFGLCVL